jgi:PAS domain S-box-containing protein
MPGFSAPEALRLLQESRLDIPFLIISGGIKEGVAIEAMKAGAHDFLMKGALGRLVPAVQRELRDAAVRRARRAAEAALQESELRYRSVWENSTDAVLLIDLGGIIRFANPAISAVFGYEPKAVVGLTLDAFQPLEIPPGAWWNKIRSVGAMKATETFARRRDGSPIEIDLAVTEMRMGEELLVVAFCRDITERKRAERELAKSREEFAAAREIQQSLFPKTAPSLPGFDIAGASHPAEAAGGDYYDFLNTIGGGLTLVVADVSGHGVGPALLMAETRAYLRPLTKSYSNPAELLSKANALLAEDLGSDRYITLLLVRLDPITRTLHYSNAGHPAGLVLGTDGTIRARLARLGRPFGRQKTSLPYEAGTPIELNSGEILLMLTDGIDEAMGSDGECFGLERAAEVVARNRERSAQELVELLCSAAREYAAPEPQADDLTVIIAKVL